MKRLICGIKGHDPIAVRPVGLVARPGGMLPSLDGAVAFEPHPDGTGLACVRCRQVLSSGDLS